MKAEFEFNLIKIFSSLIVNARRIFTKNVAKRSRDKMQSKSNACLIKILSSLIASARRILSNSKWKLDQVVSFEELIEDKEKKMSFRKKSFFLFQSARIKIVKIRKQSLIKNELRMF